MLPWKRIIRLEEDFKGGARKVCSEILSRRMHNSVNSLYFLQINIQSLILIRSFVDEILLPCQIINPQFVVKHCATIGGSDSLSLLRYYIFGKRINW